MKMQINQLGMGTWHLGEGTKETVQKQATVLRYGIEHGVKIIDTAEMYGSGAAERLIGQVIQTYPRNELFIISKFYPWNAAPDKLAVSLHHSLARLQTNYLDLYLLHWRQKEQLSTMIEQLEKFKRLGLIKHWGVSNFDLNDLKELVALPKADQCFANEDLYNLGSRGVENDLLAFQRQHNIKLIAYSPFGSEKSKYLTIKPGLKKIAAQKEISVHQLLLAWLLQQKVICIPKTGSLIHLKENLAAQTVKLTPEELKQLDQLYPRPNAATPLDVI
jgi:diketogulonate reductase-like aldo/keto reductase